MSPITRNPKGSLVVIGGGYNAYGLVRAGGEAEIPVILVTDRSLNSTAYSRHVKTHIRLSSLEPSALVREEFLGAVKEIGPALLIPTNEEWVSELLENHEFYDSVPGLKSYLQKEPAKLCIDKIAFASFCEREGFLSPRTLGWNPGGDWGEFLNKVDSLRYPVVVKPATKGREFVELGFHYYRKVDDRIALDRLIAGFKSRPPRMAFLVQEFIEGTTSRLVSLQGYVFSSGRLVVSQYRKIAQTHGPIGSAVSALIEKVDTNVLATTEKILRAIGYRGFFDIEFKETERGLVLIEINPRPGMLNYATVSDGINLAEAAYRDQFEEGLPSLVYRHEEDWVWVRTLPYLYARFLRKNGEKKSVGAVQRDCFWSASDPAPGLAQVCLDVFSFGKRALMGRFARRLSA